MGFELLSDADRLTLIELAEKGTSSSIDGHIFDLRNVFGEEYVLNNNRYIFNAGRYLFSPMLRSDNDKEKLELWVNEAREFYTKTRAAFVKIQLDKYRTLGIDA